jgi:hypothetical protein
MLPKCLIVSGSRSGRKAGDSCERFSQGLDSYEGVVTLVALVGALVTRVAPCEGREFPFNGANIRNAAKSRQGGDDPLGPCLILK